MERLRFYMGESVRGRVLGVTPEEWNKVESRLHDYFPGWTQYEARGSWEGVVEDSRVYEVLSEGATASHRINELARELAHITGQEAVLWTRESVEAKLVRRTP